MRNTNIIYFFIFISFILFGCSSNATEPKSRGLWNDVTSTFIDKSRNLQWELSNVDNWRVAEEYRLPENAQFCAAADQFGICVLYLAIPIDPGEEHESIWNASDEFVNGMANSFIKQAPVFPGIQYSTPQVEKVKFMFKDALKVTLITDVTDARIMSTESVPFAFQIYAFIKDDEVIEIAAMVPQFFIDANGNEPFDDLLNRFSYIDATKEVSK